MRQKSESMREPPGVLTPSVPRDIGLRSQRQRILSAMALSCAEKTFAATTIADIVGHASISRATFYKHFGNKRECFDATAEGFLEELQNTAVKAHSGESPPTDAVRNVIKAVLDRLAAKPAYANLLLVEAPTAAPRIVRRCRELVIRSLELQLQTGAGPPGNGADPAIAFGRGQVLIVDYLAAGKAKRLPSLLPELLYIALLPYMGQEPALEQARFRR